MIHYLNDFYEFQEYSNRSNNNLGGITLTIIITQALISQLTDYIDWFQKNRLEGSIVFLTLYLLFGLFALPASFHKYLAGVIFGFIPGVLIAWIGSMLGAIFPFIAGKNGQIRMLKEP